MIRMMICAFCGAALALVTACYVDDGETSRTNTDAAIAAVTGKSVPRLNSRDSAVALPQPRKKWTVLVYLDGDNSLSAFADDDVAEMMATGSGAGLNIVLLWDNDTSQGGSRARHGYYYVTRQGAVLLDDAGEVNMGDPRTATNFIDFAARNFPAEKYLWIWWNHGGAVDRNAGRGVAWDDGSDDHLTESEQLTVMKHLAERIGKKADIVGFDACLMATAEIACQYAETASYLVASEQTEPGDGWDYAFLSTITANPSSSARTVARAILTRFSKYYSGEDDATLSVLYLAHAPAFSATLDSFARAAMASGVSGSVFRAAAQGLPPFGAYDNGTRECYFTKDLYGYLMSLANTPAIPAGLKSKAETCAAILRDKKFIPYEWHGTAWKNRAFGLSVTLKHATTIYKKLELCRSTKWDEFLNWAKFPNNDYTD